MQLLKLLSSAALVISTVTAAAIPNPLLQNDNLKLLTKKSGGWDYGNDIMRGVNLGGWFVLEAYIVPSLFQPWVGSNGDQSQVPVDEYHFTQVLGKDLALDRLKQHWSSWYIEDDFQHMSELGLNTVRIPIGYWAFDLLEGDPYVQGQVEYLDQAIEWCRKYGISVWIDLHGAPGSQNGFDNSGLRDSLKFQDGDNTQFTINLLNTVFAKYGSDKFSDVVIGIELLNEPLGPDMDMDYLKTFYTSCYNNLRDTSNSPVVIHDAFMPSGYWNDFMTVESGQDNVVVDHHYYQVFSAGELSRDINAHISVACGWGTAAKQEYHWNIAGEWSGALTDCAPWLNGVNRGARWEGQYDNSPYMGSCQPYLDISQWPSDYNTNVRKYIEAQLDAFEHTGGWIFWNWKTESAGEWDFQKLTYYKLFPQPLTDRQYPGQCSF
ncbi:Glucan 13-beta-glucosidase [Spathaspora sp. JA1]|nr:Glucan 13-beta-glucosidase [Spathaspora sp. JA1]